MNSIKEVIDYVECSQAALDAADKLVKESSAKGEKIASAIPDVIDALIQFERIDPKDREKCAELLKDPVKALEILKKTADTNRTIRPRQLGHAVAEKKASDSSSPYVGLRSSGERASDRRFDEILGIGR
jgi:hypothetical protein